MTDPFHDLPETAKIAGDVLSIETLLGSLASLLPAVAALLASGGWGIAVKNKGSAVARQTGAHE